MVSTYNITVSLVHQSQARLFSLHILHTEWERSASWEVLPGSPEHVLFLHWLQVLGKSSYIQCDCILLMP